MLGATDLCATLGARSVPVSPPNDSRCLRPDLYYAIIHRAFGTKEGPVLRWLLSVLQRMLNLDTLKRAVDKDPAQSRERLFECKVYYEDTDCMAVVYHANYLKYLERARTEYLADRLAGVVEYHNQGYSFMVHKIEMVFHAPAKLGDELVVRTWIESTTRFRIVVKQIIIKKGEPKDYLVTATITLVAVGDDGQLRQVPGEFHDL